MKMKQLLTTTAGLVVPLLLATAQLVEAKEVFYDFELAAVLGNDYSPDCQDLQVERRWLFLAKNHGDPNSNRDNNPAFTNPGPLIEATEGDTIVVRVTNEHHALGASLHFHGIHQLGTPWSDGPSFITQCPLAAKQSQEYRFQAYPPGTHYWHAHSSMDVADGLSGPLIVHPKQPEPFLYDNEYTLFLTDFYSETGEAQHVGLDQWPFTWIGNPDSVLINGRGVAAACQEGGADFGDTTKCLITCNETLSLLSTFEVEASQTYRLRIINSAQLVMQNIAIAGHNMTIVEVEGTYVDPPVQVSNYDLAPGQRVSVLVTANQEPGSYLIETTVRERNITGLFGRAILHYASTDLVLPTESPLHTAWDDSEAAKMVEDALRTQNASQYEEYAALTAPPETVQRWVIVGTQNQLLDESGNPTQLRWAINNISNAVPSEPLIGSAVKAARELGWPVELKDTIDVPQSPPFVWNYTDLVANPGGPGPALGQQGTAVIRLRKGDVFEIVLQNARALNGAAEFHPWHSHGHSFWVVGRGEGIFDAESDPATYNLEDPLLRDTATVWPLGWTALRFYANNPGVWYFHCHLASHLTMGMALSLIVEPETVEDPPDSVEYCGREAFIKDDDNETADSSAFSSCFVGTGLALLGSLIILFID